MSIDIDRYKLAWELGAFYTNVQMKPTLRRNDWIWDLYRKMTSLTAVSQLPIPAGRQAKCTQCGVYWDKTNMHVWYGSILAAGDAGDEDIFYTKAASPFTSWDAPVEVISAPAGEGCRDANCVVTEDTLYISTQNYTDATSVFEDPRIYSIGKTDDFTDSGDYTDIGVLLALGAGGTYDDAMVASPAIQLVDGIPIMAYEANDGANYSVGLAYSDDIDSVPYTRIDEAKDFAGAVVRNPTANTRAIVPDEWVSRGCLSIHYYDNGTNFWNEAFLVGDPFANTWTLKYPVNPTGYDNYCNSTFIGVIDDYLYVMLGTARDAAQRNPELYRVAV